MGKKKKVKHPKTSELLAELSSCDVQAWTPHIQHLSDGTVPPWCELVVEVKRGDEWPLNMRAPLRRHDGELIMAKIEEALHPGGARLLADVLWFELDDVVDRIQRRVAKEKAPKPVDVGQAQGLALAIAILRNPKAYDIDAVRDEAMTRWAARAR